jgi:hypothetical protein
MKDGFVTDHAMFAAVLCYVFSTEALIKIDLIDFKPQFTLDAPSIDCDEYLKEYLAGTLAVADAQSLFTSYLMIMATVRKMRSDKRDSWVSLSWQRQWIAGRRDDGRRIE